MNTTELISFFERDLKRVITEIELYENEEDIWKVEKHISNSAGNLILHLIGNLHTFIGKEIGLTDYIRNRELEFSQKHIPRVELIANINDTLTMIKAVLLAVENDDLKKDYPILKFSEITTTEFLLVHLTSHLAYHLGQINYHRRLIAD